MENDHFIQVTITKGRLVTKENGLKEKVIDETVKDDLYQLEDKVAAKLARRLLKNGNLDYESLQTK